MADNVMIGHGRPLTIVGHTTAGPVYEIPKDGEGIFVGHDGKLWLSGEAQGKADSRIVHALASLAAAISLLERGGKAAKKAAPSDKMFDQMLDDYRKALDAARQALATPDSGEKK